MSVVQLWNFFLYNISIFLFRSVDIIFTTLTKNTIKIEKLKKTSIIIFLVTAPLTFLIEIFLLSFFYE